MRTKTTCAYRRKKRVGGPREGIKEKGLEVDGETHLVRHGRRKHGKAAARRDLGGRDGRIGCSNDLHARYII